MKLDVAKPWGKPVSKMIFVMGNFSEFENWNYWKTGSEHLGEVREPLDRICEFQW